MSLDHPFDSAQDRTPIRVNNPRRLGAWQLPCERVPVGVPRDYKPSMALLPSGELVMVGLWQERLPDGEHYRESTTIWRSLDGGRTWSERALVQDMIGREQFLTCTSDGTLFATSHILAMDVNNTDQEGQSYLHRSTDRGRTWQRTKVLIEGNQRCGAPAKAGTGTSRNIVEMPDGTLLWGISLGGSPAAYLWASADHGNTWDKSLRVSIEGRHENTDAFFAEDFTFRARSGKLLHFVRVGPPSPMFPMNDGRPAPSGNDAIDRMMRSESADDGKTWSPLRDFGDYGMHYPRVMRLKDGRLLLTFTQRSTFCPLGLQAILSYDDGETWDFDNDRIIIEGKTPWAMDSGGGFGNTLQLEDGTLVSCYSYRGPTDGETRVEVARWSLP